MNDQIRAGEPRAARYDDRDAVEVVRKPRGKPWPLWVWLTTGVVGLWLLFMLLIGGIVVLRLMVFSALN